MWTNFFLAAASASAALAGLVIVAVSVNITRILQFPQLPTRAAATVVNLILILVSSMATLVPQPTRFLGFEIVFFGLLSWLFEVRSSQKAIAARVAAHRPRFESLLQATLGQLQTLPFIGGGVWLILRNLGGLYAIAFGTLVIFMADTLNTWVLMVEILR
jgi:modulator of FtsH protease